ncbi:MAG: cation:dicarboxylase symporter family transporter, partial [Bacteroidales bacterium]
MKTILRALKKLPLWAKIFLGMGLGILWGLISVWAGWENFTNGWIRPWGNIFLKLLKLIAVPLIFVSLVKGISSLTDITKLSRLGLKTIAIYVVTTVIATTVGLGMVNLIKPGSVFPQEKQAMYREKFGGQVEIRQESARSIEDQGPLQFLEDMVPDNIFLAAGDNAKMLQIIFFAILFSLALVMVP